jgi:hypothetical protein
MEVCPREYILSPVRLLVIGLVHVPEDGYVKGFGHKGRSRFKVQGSRFKVQGSRFKVQGSRFKVQGSGLQP